MTAARHDIQRGIDYTESGLSDTVREAALAFFHRYASSHAYFTGGDVLAAWRDEGPGVAHADWRNRWGAICSTAAKLGWVAKAGRARPTSAQSHSATLVLWESQLTHSAESQMTHSSALNLIADEVKQGG